MLASASPQRRAILERLGVRFTVRVTGVAELEQGDPRQLTVENARRKARAAVRAGAPEVVLGHAAEDMAQRLTVNGRGALEVRVVRPPHQLVDANLVAHLGLVALHE